MRRGERLRHEMMRLVEKWYATARLPMPMPGVHRLEWI